MLEWYTSLLTFHQATAVYLVSIVVLWVGLWVFFVKTGAAGDSNRGAGPVALALALLAYPALYWTLCMVVAFLDLIGWLWAH